MSSVGTMIGLEAHIHHAMKSLVERLCDFKIYELSVFGYIGSLSAPDEATLKKGAHALQCTTAGPYNAVPTNLLPVGSVCSLGPDILDPYSQPRGPVRIASDSSTLDSCLAKVQAGRECSEWRRHS